MFFVVVLYFFINFYVSSLFNLFMYLFIYLFIFFLSLFQSLGKNHHYYFTFVSISNYQSVPFTEQGKVEYHELNSCHKHFVCSVKIRLNETRLSQYQTRPSRINVFTSLALSVGSQSGKKLLFEKHVTRFLLLF